MFLTKTDWKKSILETTKYPFKPIEFDDKNLQVIDDLYKGLYRKRQLAYGGLLKQIKKELELDDIENGDLIHVDEETGEISEGTKIIAAWDWQRKIILLNKKEKWIPIHYACKRSKNYIYLFFCYRAKWHYTDRKVTLFCGFFFEYVYTYPCLPVY